MDMDLNQQVLRTDVAGMPLEWIGYQDAVRLISLDQVSYSLGRPLYTIHGGINAISGLQSVIEVNAIIASYGHHPHTHLFSEAYTPPLSNKALFRRDQSLCLYCGEQFPNFMLSRDHVRPLSQGGADTWGNVLTACKRSRIDQRELRAARLIRPSNCPASFARISSILSRLHSDPNCGISSAISTNALRPVGNGRLHFHHTLLAIGREYDRAGAGRRGKPG